MQKRLYKVLSPRPVNGFAAAVRATCGISSFVYELHAAPFQADVRLSHRRREEGWGSTKRRSTLSGSLNPTRKKQFISIGRTYRSLDRSQCQPPNAANLNQYRAYLRHPVIRPYPLFQKNLAEVCKMGQHPLQKSLIKCRGQSPVGGHTMELFIGDRAVVFNRLKHSLELLAAPSDFQLRVAPGFGYRADALYIGFDHWRMKVLGNFESELASAALSCVRSL